MGEFFSKKQKLSFGQQSAISVKQKLTLSNIYSLISAEVSHRPFTQQLNSLRTCSGVASNRFFSKKAFGRYTAKPNAKQIY